MKQTTIVCLTALLSLLFVISGTAQKRQPPSVSENDVKKFSAIIASDDFAKAEKKRDLESMRKMLRGTKLTLQPADPQLIPKCVPPYGTLEWGWQLVVGPLGPYWVYGEYCKRGGGGNSELPVWPMSELRMSKLPAEQKQYFNAFEKASKAKEFTDAVKTGNANLAKRLLIANGAPQSLIIETISPKSTTSDPIPGEIINGGCSQWKLFTWWQAYPTPGHYVATWQCVQWVVDGIVVYDGNQ